MPDEVPPEFKIGLLIDLGIGHRVQLTQAAKLAVDEVNGSGGLPIGGRPHRVILVEEVTESTPEATLQGAQRLINLHRVAVVIGPNYSRNAIPVARLAQRSGIPMISPGSTHAAATADKPFAFRVAFVDQRQGQALARFAFQGLGARRAAVLYDVTGSHHSGVAEVFQRVFEDLGGRVVASESYTAGDKDFRRQLNRIAAGDPHVLLLPNFDVDVQAQARQARELGIEATFLGTDGWSLPQLQQHPELDGSFASQHWHPDLTTTNAQARKLAAASQRIRGEPPDAIMALTYDAFGLVLEAAHGLPSAEPRVLRQALAELEQYPGAAGTITYRGTGGDPLKNVWITHFTDGGTEIHPWSEPRGD